MSEVNTDEAEVPKELSDEDYHMMALAGLGFMLRDRYDKVEALLVAARTHDLGEEDRITVLALCHYLKYCRADVLAMCTAKLQAEAA